MMTTTILIIVILNMCITPILVTTMTSTVNRSFFFLFCSAVTGRLYSVVLCQCKGAAHPQLDCIELDPSPQPSVRLQFVMRFHMPCAAGRCHWRCSCIGQDAMASKRIKLSKLPAEVLDLQLLSEAERLRSKAKHGGETHNESHQQQEKKDSVDISVQALIREQVKNGVLLIHSEPVPSTSKGD